MPEPLNTKPPLTTAMQATDAATGASPAGAGGWLPSASTVYAIGALGVALGGAVPVIPSLIPGRLGVALAGLCGAIGGGLVYFATKSAGPRSLS